jgi:hypothetical protein
MVLPQTQVKFTSVIKRPLPGNYVVQAIITYGGLSQAIGRLPFTIARKVAAKGSSFLSNSPIGLVVNKEMVDVFVSPNSYRTQILSLTNEENQSVKIKTNLKYLSFDENSDIIAADTGDNRFSCINWLTIEPKQFEIPPGETKTLKLEVKVPEANPGGRYACIDWEALLADAKDTTIPTPLQVPVILTIPGLVEKKAEIVKVDIGTGNPPRFSVYFKNLSGIHIKPKIKIELNYLTKAPSSGDMTYVGGREPKPELIGTFGMKPLTIPVLPGGITKMEQDYEKKLDPGNYTAVVTADFGGTDPAVFIQKFQVK